MPTKTLGGRLQVSWPDKKIVTMRSERANDTTEVVPSTQPQGRWLVLGQDSAGLRGTSGSDVVESAFSRRTRALSDDPAHGFPGNGALHSQQVEFARFRMEMAKTDTHNNIARSGQRGFNQSAQRLV